MKKNIESQASTPDLEGDFLKKIVYEKVAEPNLRPTELKPLDVCKMEAKAQVNFAVDEYFKTIKEAEEAFLSAANKEEIQSVKDIIEKARLNGLLFLEEPLITTTQAATLYNIARRATSQGQHENAGTMLRYLILLVPDYEFAWIGYATSHQLRQDLEGAEGIYKTAMKLLPKSYYLKYYAASFYLVTHNYERAKEILDTASHELLENNMEASKEYNQIKALSDQI